MRKATRKRIASREDAPPSPPAVVDLAAWKARGGLQCEYQGESPYAFQVGDGTLTIHFLSLLEPLPDYGLEAGDRLMITVGLVEPIPGEFAAAETPQGWRVGKLDPEGIRAGSRLIDPGRASRVGRVSEVTRGGRFVWRMPPRKGGGA